MLPILQLFCNGRRPRLNKTDSLSSDYSNHYSSHPVARMHHLSVDRMITYYDLVHPVQSQ